VEVEVDPASLGLGGTTGQTLQLELRNSLHPPVIPELAVNWPGLDRVDGAPAPV
jgi:hypothetical protein